jgi:hypothetical protein
MQITLEATAIFLMFVIFLSATHPKGERAPDLQDAVIYKLTGYKGWEGK